MNIIINNPSQPLLLIVITPMIPCQPSHYPSKYQNPRKKKPKKKLELCVEWLSEDVYRMDCYFSVELYFQHHVYIYFNVQ